MELKINNQEPGLVIGIGYQCDKLPKNGVGISDRLRLKKDNLDCIIQSNPAYSLDISDREHRDVYVQTYPAQKLTYFAIYNQLEKSFNDEVHKSTTSSIPSIQVNRPLAVGELSGTVFTPTYLVPTSLTVQDVENWIDIKGKKAGKVIPLGVASNFIDDFNERTTYEALNSIELTPVESLSVIQSIARWNKHLMNNGLIFRDQAKGATDSYLLQRGDRGDNGNIQIIVNDQDFTQVFDKEKIADALNIKQDSSVYVVLGNSQMLSNFNSDLFWNEVIPNYSEKNGVDFVRLRNILNLLMTARPDLGLEAGIYFLDYIQSEVETISSDPIRQAKLINSKIGSFDSLTDGKCEGLIRRIYTEAVIREQQAIIISNKDEIGQHTTAMNNVIEEKIQVKKELEVVRMNSLDERKSLDHLQVQKKEIEEQIVSAKRQLSEISPMLLEQQNTREAIVTDIKRLEQELRMLGETRGSQLEAIDLLEKEMARFSLATEEARLQINLAENEVSVLQQEKINLEGQLQGLRGIPIKFIDSLETACQANMIGGDKTVVRKKIVEAFENLKGDEQFNVLSPLQQVKFLIDQGYISNVIFKEVRQSLLDEALLKNDSFNRGYQDARAAVDRSRQLRTNAYNEMGKFLGIANEEILSRERYSDSTDNPQFHLFQEAVLSAENEEGEMVYKLAKLENSVVDLTFKQSIIESNE